MQQDVFSKTGKKLGTVMVIDRSRRGQRCVTYVDYKQTGGRK